jgi:lipopolysaccharide transport system ATP-binding protein
MSLPAIEVSGLSKRYVLQHESRHDNLRDTLHHTARKLWRRARWGTSFDTEEFMALDDVSFSVQPGEVVGIIGRNGAGKSTLLKILSRITEPTSGKITLRGRVASLLEVGTGFHPELSGRENIFLNGAILGMSRAEIRKKFDEIVAFAEVEKFLDTPVKRYSSGMYVRLAFAVAAHLEPDILIVDEVLAVGDAQFQKKCLGKIRAVSRDEGRTVLFVSHNMGVIANLCSRAVYLDNGSVRAEGAVDGILASYIQSGSVLRGEVFWEKNDRSAGNSRVRLNHARILCDGQISADTPIDRPVHLEYDFEVLDTARHVASSIHLYDKQGTWVLCSGVKGTLLQPGGYRHRIIFPAEFFNDGLYTLSIALVTDGNVIEVLKTEAISFVVHETGTGREEYGGVIHGCLRPRLESGSQPLPPVP